MDDQAGVGGITLGQAIDWIKDLGTLGVLIIVLWWGKAGVWLWGWQRDRDIQREQGAFAQYKLERDREVERERAIGNEYRIDRDRWQTTAMDLLQTAQLTTGALATNNRRRA